MSDTPSAEKIAANYAAMLDSVAIINGSKPDVVGMTDAEWTANVEANKEHLRMMVAKDYWTTEDMTTINAAIA